MKLRPGPLVTTALVVVVANAWFLRPPFSLTFGLLVLVGTAGAAMTNGVYAVRRVLRVIPVLLAVSFFVFWLMATLPGDPAINILGPTATADEVARLNEELGLDEPFFNRYGNWLGDVVVGDLGSSIRLREDISDGVARSLTPSLQLMGYSLVLAALISVPLGVYSAYKKGRRQDRIINYTMLGLFAVPNFVLAVLLVLFLATGGMSIAGVDVGFKILPAVRYVPFGENWLLHFKHLVLPCLSLGLGQAAVLMRLLRSDMIATLRLPFIDLARAKGLSTSRILWGHALRPSSFTFLTVMGLTMGSLIGGALIIEVIFTLPGIGSYIFGGITQRDLIAVQGAVLVVSTLYILILTMVDFLYLAVDPRLRSHGATA